MSSVNPMDEQDPNRRATGDPTDSSLRARVLAEPQEVLRALEGGSEAVVLDVRAGRAGFEGYQQSRFPGAVYADLETDLAAPEKAGAPELGGRHPLPEPAVFAGALAQWGIGRADQPVFLYDATGGAMAAARLWWMLVAIGHRNSRIVDGGWQSLARELDRKEIPPETGSSQPDAPEESRRSPAPRPEVDWSASRWLLPVAESEQVATASADGVSILDVRSPVRYRGEEDPFDPNPGRIPGACNLDFTRNLDEDGRFLSSEELRSLYAAQLGDVPPDQWIVHCGSGVTACHTLAAMAAIGLDGAALYVGSYSEWCRSGRKIETG